MGSPIYDVFDALFLASLIIQTEAKLYIALAQAAVDLGAQVILITATTSLPAPISAKTLKVHTTEEMSDAVLDASGDADVLLMAAAVADFRSTMVSGKKFKKTEGIPKIEFETTLDISAAVAISKLQKSFVNV